MSPLAPAPFGLVSAAADVNSDGGSSLAMVLSALLIAVTIMGIMAFCVWMCGCGPDQESIRTGRYFSLTGRSAMAQSSGSPAAAAAKAAQVGLSKQAIEQLPSLSYDCLRLQRKDSDLGCCAVCLTEFTPEDKLIRVMPRCGHCFHSDCISMWLFSHSSCPMCRQSLALPTMSCKTCGKLNRSWTRGSSTNASSSPCLEPPSSSAGATESTQLQEVVVVVDTLDRH